MSDYTAPLFSPITIIAFYPLHFCYQYLPTYGHFYLFYYSSFISYPLLCFSGLYILFNASHSAHTA